MTENWAEKTSASGISISGNSPHLLHPHSLHYPNSQKRLCGGYRGMLWGGKLKKTVAQADSTGTFLNSTHCVLNIHELEDPNVEILLDPVPM